MKSTSVKAIVALCLAGILGGISPVMMKVALKEFTPVQIVFTRVFFTTIILFPIVFLTKRFTFKRKDIPHIIFASLLFSVNILFFIVGLQFTTSIVSQLMYLLVPTFVIALSHFFLKSPVKVKHIISIIIGAVGGIILLTGNNISHLSMSLGTTKGNVIILCGVIAWSIYLIVTKKFGGKYSTLSIVVVNNITVMIIAGIMLLIQRSPIFSSYSNASLPALLSLFCLVIFNSVVFFFLLQWSIKLVSPFAVSLSSYLGPLVAGLVAIPLFGETITVQLLMSAVFIGLSSYLTFRKGSKT